MPWAEEKGLFPGRGMPGAELGAAPGAGFPASGALGALGVEVCGAELGDAGAAGAGASVFFASAAGAAAGAGGAVFGAATFGSSFGLAFGNASRSFLATGGVIVDEPLLTYSPSCSSFAKASLVSTPSSLAMS